MTTPMAEGKASIELPETDIEILRSALEWLRSVRRDGGRRL